MTEKSLIRQKIKAVLQGKSEILPDLSEKICKKIVKSEFYKNADFIFSYMALNDEVNLSSLINESIKNGKKVFIPKIVPKSSEMNFYEFSPKMETCISDFGIVEPTDNNKKFEIKSYNKNILILVPGRAFSKNGERVGRGKGYYDDFLAEIKKTNLKNAFFCGICFDCQILEQIPTEAHDVKMDFVISESF